MRGGLELDSGSGEIVASQDISAASQTLLVAKDEIDANKTRRTVQMLPVISFNHFIPIVLTFSNTKPLNRRL